MNRQVKDVLNHFLLNHFLLIHNKIPMHLVCKQI